MSPRALPGGPMLTSLTPLVSAGCGVHDWQRVQAGVPERSAFRGPEDVSDFDNPPPPTEGQGATRTEAATEIACRGPRVSRAAGVVCSHR